METVQVDVKRYRQLVKDEVRRLRSMPPTGMTSDAVTVGRVSGCELALSFLDECIAKDQ